jgi:hypothetical protein
LKNRTRLLTTSVAAAVALLIALPTIVLADFALADWRYAKEVQVPPVTQEDLVELLPDADLYGGSAPGLVDLRIISADNSETPYKLEVRRGQREQRDVRVAVRDQGYVQDEYNTFIADLAREGVLHNRVEFQTTSINFQRTAIVETSNDLATWAKVAEGTVHDFRLVDTVATSRNTAVAYPDSTARYIRVRVLDDGNGPLAITGARVFAVQEELRREVSWPVTIADISHSDNQQATLVELDLGGSGIPTDRLAVTVDDVNFDRDVTLEASDDGETWRTVQSRAGIFAYDTPRFTGESLSFTYPETATRYLRLAIHDADSPPLTVTDLQVWGVERRVLFFAKPGEAYKAYYGNAEALRPTYDIDRLLGFLDTDNLPAAGLGAQADNTEYVKKLAPFTERFPWLLPLVLALAGLLVGGILLSVVRQARKALPPQEQ